MNHDWQLVNSAGEDAEGKSLTLNYYCPRCGTLKVDYRHNGGKTSPNFPMYSGIGGPINGVAEPQCKG